MFRMTQVTKDRLIRIRLSTMLSLELCPPVVQEFLRLTAKWNVAVNVPIPIPYPLESLIPAAILVFIIAPAWTRFVPANLPHDVAPDNVWDYSSTSFTDR